MDLHVATYNIHKGFSQFNRRMVLHELRDRLRESNADIVFLQEVQGAHSLHASRYENWPAAPQYEFLADTVWGEYAYGQNAVYDHGHHGNAILSRYPIVSIDNQDISTHAFESRGLLHCEIHIPPANTKIHCLCVHLALHEHGRKRQICSLIDRIRAMVPPDEALVIAGDFNDWRNRIGHRLADELDCKEAFRDLRGRPARSFPSRLPIFRLDRIYVRGFSVQHTQVHHGHPWSKISDHAMLTARLTMQAESSEPR